MVDFSRSRTQRCIERLERIRIAGCADDSHIPDDYYDDDDDLEVGIGCAGGCEDMSPEETAYFLANYDEDRYDLAENMRAWEARRRYAIVGAAAVVAATAFAALVWVVQR